MIEARCVISRLALTHADAGFAERDHCREHSESAEGMIRRNGLTAVALSHFRAEGYRVIIEIYYNYRGDPD